MSINYAANNSLRSLAIREMTEKINVAKDLTNRKSELLQEKTRLQNVLQQYHAARQAADKVITVCTNGLNSYKQERLACLEEQVKENLNTIFPEDNFNVKFETSTYRGKEIIDFYTGHGDRLFPTMMQNGRLFRQICSFSISTMIQILAGCEILIMDEAINSGDIESTKVVSNLIHNLIDNGYQIILIEHKDALYKDLPRVQYNLVRNKTLNKVTEVIRNEYT